MAQRSQNGFVRVINESHALRTVMLTLTAQQLVDLHLGALTLLPQMSGEIPVFISSSAILRLDGVATITIPSAINLYCGTELLSAIWDKTTATTADHMVRKYAAAGDGAVAPLAAALTLQMVTAISTLQGAAKVTSVGAGGANFAANDTFTVAGGIVGRVDTVNAGAVLTYTLTNTGTTVTLGNAKPATATSGTGTGLTINVTQLNAEANPLTMELEILFRERG